ncbi:manganese-dependent inorganic pyrophosphatase [Geomicrobium sp. JCM 19039]|uniref:manganese-dependent inorganic pyrophosphatase n=1 Tax=Geomicrobium sp. JCM 19039 TaxID=1460636 RepID=UPI00045F2C9F|nr:manganese-dependent inorganic pyrophosphatase [Geomicrobium sp. JCM 19039]GAK12131.1 manganese-dependent inorganic pyrophosphatase [Geomicrobium sp. JCM 19039]
MSKIIVTGHRNPDTDSITSAIVYSYFKKQRGIDVLPIRLGEMNKETEHALSYFNVDAPVLVDDNIVEQAEELILVDHNERQQSIEHIEKFKITEVIDHHRIANFETMDPLYYRAEPVGCTATILLKLFKEYNVEVPKQMAGLMLSAIISDSLLFKSPTCTDEDFQAAKALSEIAGVDANVYGLDMLKAGADLTDKSINELVTMDAKEFEVGEHKLEIAQVNTVDVNGLLEQKQAIEDTLDVIVKDKGLKLFLFVITDILNNDSTILVAGGEDEKVERAFDVKIENHTALLKGVVSRKKQIAPVLMRQFS